MTNLADALKAAGIAVPVEQAPAPESNGVIDPAALAGVDTSTMQGNTPVDDLAPPAFLDRRNQSGAEAPSQPPVQADPALGTGQIDTGLGSVAVAQSVAVPPVVNTVVAPPVVTPEVTPAAPIGGQAGNAGSNQPNSLADKRAVLRTIAQLGESEGAGANARAGFFEKVADAARMGALVEDDADVVHTRYAEGVAKAKGIAVVKMPSETQQKSKVKTMIKLGMLPAVRADVLLAQVRSRIEDAREAGSAPKKSPADIYLAAARMQLSQPQHMLTDDQIDQAMASKTPDPKLVADLLYQNATALDKLLADDAATPLDEESAKLVQEILPMLVKRVNDLGGTTQQQKDAKKIEEQQTKLAEKAAKAANKGVKLRHLGAIPMGAAHYRSA